MGLGDRMKKYEASYESEIIWRLPIVVRIDGKGFSKWTKTVGAAKPFDDRVIRCMASATAAIVKNVEGCLFGFTQSDEATFILRNDQSLWSTPWFNNRIQKMTSTIASIATAYFNNTSLKEFSSPPLALFDARVFGVPTIQEAKNCLIWRQNDAVKNSISSACYYGVAEKVGRKTARKMMHGLNQKQQQELLFTTAKINWNDYPVKFKRGVGVYTNEFKTDINGNSCVRSVLKVDESIPIFTQEKEFLDNILGV